MESRIRKSSLWYHHSGRIITRGWIFQLNDWVIKKFQHYKTIQLSDLNIFFHQFQALICAGIPLIQILQLLSVSQTSIAMRELIAAIRVDILSGKNLSASMSQYTIFDALTCHLIHIGEQSGKLEHMLMLIVNHYQKKLSMRNQIKQSLFYPCIITFTAILITFSMLLFVIPRFALLFEENHHALPTLTLIIFTCSRFLNQYLMVFLLSFLPIVYLLKKAFNLKSVKTKIFTYFKQLPYIKTCHDSIRLSRFNRHLAICFSAGIPLSQALLLSIPQSNPDYFTNRIQLLHHKINAGLSLHSSMQSYTEFPALMIQMIKIGEESGKLDSVLHTLANLYEEKVDQYLRQFNQLLEPLIMLILGGLIGILVIGMYLPIFKLGSVI